MLFDEWLGTTVELTLNMSELVKGKIVLIFNSGPVAIFQTRGCYTAYKKA